LPKASAASSGPPSPRLSCFQLIPPARVVTVAGLAICRRNQAAGAAHGGAVIGVDSATYEAYLVRLVGLAVHASVRPGKIMPATHFEKTFQDWTCHARCEPFDFTKVFPHYSLMPASESSLLAISRGNMASTWSHYSVT
jgi:hypothetical protein